MTANAAAPDAVLQLSAAASEIADIHGQACLEMDGGGAEQLT
jgi:hypothetical protein